MNLKYYYLLPNEMFENMSDKILYFITFNYFLNICCALCLPPFCNLKSEDADDVSSRKQELLSLLNDTILLNPLTFLDTGPNLQEIISGIDEEDFFKQYNSGADNPDKYLNFTELVFKYTGLIVEVYIVETEDGYKISLYRIPGKGDPVLLVHGLLSSAIDWLTAGPNDALPYLLVNHGYDVWLLNARGSTNDSRGHVYLSADTDEAEYWNFSWDEIGRYDLPATIDHILRVTGKKKLKYVGHSQGTTSFFVLASELPEYNNKIEIAAMLSPVAYMSHLKSPLVRLLVPAEPILGRFVTENLGLNNVNLNNPLMHLLTKGLCGTKALAALLCNNIMSILGGFDYSQLDVANINVVFAHTPSSSSLKQMLHYMQEISSKKFQQYDYRSIKNLKKYGSMDPPRYPVEKINTSVAIFYKKDTDWFAAYEDVLMLVKQLPNVVDFYEVPHEGFSHTDYLWAKDVKELVYGRVLKLFESDVVN